MSIREPALRLQAPASPRLGQWHVIRAWFLKRPGVARLLLVAFTALLWEVTARVFGDPLFVAPPSLVIGSLGDLFRSPGVPYAFLITSIELASAFALAAFFGIALGTIVGINGFAHRSCMPIILLLYATPQVTILPLFMMMFGIGPASKIAYGFSHGIFPILVTVAAGVQNLKPILLVSSRSMGAGRLQILRHVIFPHMIPSLFTGMRLGMTATLLGVILAELYVSETGVGFFSRKFAESFNPKLLFGLIGVVATLAILMNEFIRRAELRLTRWQSA